MANFDFPSITLKGLRRDGFKRCYNCTGLHILIWKFWIYVICALVTWNLC